MKGCMLFRVVYLLFIPVDPALVYEDTGMIGVLHGVGDHRDLGSLSGTGTREEKLGSIEYIYF